ncbi:MAG: DUF5683 domain-containing protein [Flavobacteriaceae bacterium]|nr:DUF5683 domain-containing protein [Flavobacteriaceae bacterium]
MRNKLFIISFLFLAICNQVVGQELEGKIVEEEKIELLDDVVSDPVAPSRAAFYSSIVPGLGQIYNKKYWKVPLVYAGMGVPIYFWADNQRNYVRYRDEYKRRLQGIKDTSDPTFGGLDDQRLIDAQNYYRRSRDLSVVITIGVYILSIVDANVDAHLMQFNVNDKLTIKPAFELNPMDMNNQYQYAINVQYRF